MNSGQPLGEFRPTKSFFVGIDSDGCVFDSVEVKQKECIIPNTIKYWGLQSIARYVRQTAEFVNLYSKYRGLNRWPALLKVFELLRERPEVLGRPAVLPDVKKLAQFVSGDWPLINASLKTLLDETGEPVYGQALRWSEAVNTAVSAMAHGLSPFPWVRESLLKIEAHADILIVSATPTAALEKEWAESELRRYARLIAGQEVGTKKDHLALATRGHYEDGHILMIGDALGDLQAARAVGALFYPINPGDEDESWQNFHDQGWDRFLAGTYAGEYEELLLDDFNRRLPETPPWKKRTPISATLNP